MGEDKVIQRKICLLGDGAVGKTSLIRRFVLDVFRDEYLSTIGTKVSRKEFAVHSEGRDTFLTMMIWDIVGQKEYQKLHSMYYQGASGALIVCDLTREETLEHVREWVSSLFAEVGEIPVILLANKSDLADEKAEREYEAAAKALGMEFLVTSAKLGQNVEEAFQVLGAMLVGG